MQSFSRVHCGNLLDYGQFCSLTDLGSASVYISTDTFPRTDIKSKIITGVAPSFLSFLFCFASPAEISFFAASGKHFFSSYSSHIRPDYCPHIREDHSCFWLFDSLVKGHLGSLSLLRFDLRSAHGSWVSLICTNLGFSSELWELFDCMWISPYKFWFTSLDITSLSLEHWAFLDLVRISPGSLCLTARLLVCSARLLVCSARLLVCSPRLLVCNARFLVCSARLH